VNPLAFAFERVDFDADDARNIGILGTFIRVAAQDTAAKPSCQGQ
jgi:hypothetical protein